MKNLILFMIVALSPLLSLSSAHALTVVGEPVRVKVKMVKPEAPDILMQKIVELPCVNLAASMIDIANLIGTISEEDVSKLRSSEIDFMDGIRNGARTQMNLIFSGLVYEAKQLEQSQADNAVVTKSIQELKRVADANATDEVESEDEQSMLLIAANAIEVCAANQELSWKQVADKMLGL